MPAFLRRLLDRLAQKVNRSAAGTAVPAGLEPAKPGERRKPTARERTLIRRRLRALRRRREALMREVGGLVLESRHGENGAPQRLDGRTEELEAVDAEARQLVEALDELKTLDELLASGLSGRCQSCGELVAKRDHYCTNCGAHLGGGHAPGGRTTAPHSSKHGSARSAAVRGASSGRSPAPPTR